MAASFLFQRGRRNESSRAIKPTRKNRPGTERVRFAGQNDEDRLCSLLSQVWVAHLPQRRGIHQVDVASDKSRKGALGFVGGVFPHQIHVIARHSLNTCTPTAK